MPLDPGHADVFISHASEDKEAIARPLAEALRRRGLTVWYDEYVLRLGDSLRAVIDRGLASARFGVVILSPRFFAKEWPQRELNGLLARETANGRKVLLPVWHELTFEEVVKHSPILADRLAVSTARGVEEVARQILDALEPEKPESPKKSRDVATYDFSAFGQFQVPFPPRSATASGPAPATARPPTPKPAAPAPSAPAAGGPPAQRTTIAKADPAGAVTAQAPAARALPAASFQVRRVPRSRDVDRLKVLVAFLIAVSVPAAGLWLWNNVPWVAPALQGEGAAASSPPANDPEERREPSTGDRGPEAGVGKERASAPEPRAASTSSRSPLAPIVVEPTPTAPRGPRPEGIPGLLIDEIDLVGLFKTRQGYVAQVKSDAERKSYLLKEGDQLWDGDVVSITARQAVFKQIVQDPNAPRPFREVVKQLDR